MDTQSWEKKRQEFQSFFFKTMKLGRFIRWRKRKEEPDRGGVMLKDKRGNMKAGVGEATRKEKRKIKR